MPPRMEKLVFGYCALKKANGKIVEVKKVKSQKRSTKIALGMVGALLTVRPLGVAPPPLTIF